MSIRVYDNGSLFSISVGDREISDFRDRWPASGLSSLRSLWAQFEKSNGDLVDLRANGRHGGGRFGDEGALKALVDDMQCYAEAKLGLDTGRCFGRTDWKEYLGIPRKTRRKKKTRKMGIRPED